MKISKAGDGWRIDLSIRRPDGGRYRIRRKVYGSRRDAQKWAREIKTAAAMGRLIDDEPSETETDDGPAPLPFEEFAWTWFDTYVKANNKPSEVDNKETILRRHLIPFFGSQVDLRDIHPLDVERYKAEKQLEISAKTVNNTLIVLKRLVNTAVEWDLLERNHLKGVKRLKVEEYDWDWLTREETDAFLAECSDRWRLFFGAAVWTGCRLGELIAWRWGDINWRRGTITVRRSFYRGQYVTPKNGKPRNIPLNSRLQQMLRPLKKSGDKLVFVTAAGTSLDPSNVKRPFFTALEAAELRRVRFHDLRHSFASQLVTAGVSLRVVQELLGHASMTMTLRYAHLAPSATRNAVEVLVQEAGRKVDTSTKKAPSDDEA